jgi:hypothetical protein
MSQASEQGGARVRSSCPCPGLTLARARECRTFRDLQILWHVKGNLDSAGSPFASPSWFSWCCRSVRVFLLSNLLFRLDASPSPPYLLPMRSATVTKHGVIFMGSASVVVHTAVHILCSRKSRPAIECTPMSLVWPFLSSAAVFDGLPCFP